MGCIGDWEHPYITYDPALEARQLGVFWDMYKKGYMYKDKVLRHAMVIVNE